MKIDTVYRRQRYGSFDLVKKDGAVGINSNLQVIITAKNGRLIERIKVESGFDAPSSRER